MIRKATAQDVGTLTALALQLWPDHTCQELNDELGGLLAREDVAFFLACEEVETVGFAQCQLRRDYVEGTESSPVGYLEGIFVADAYRKRGIAGDLLTQCQNWARSKGCREFASDCQLGNEKSLRFHLNAGFEEANRIICFVKKI